MEAVPEKSSKGYDKFIFKNYIAYAELLIICDCDICLGIVNTSNSNLMPEGDTKLSWKNLLAKFELNTKANLIKLKEEFTESKLKDLSDIPDQWIQNLDILRRKLEILGHRISEMDLIIHILHTLPEEYETIVDSHALK
jgi:hypothetical protein